MNSQTLREARKYEEATEKMILHEERPEFHLSTRVGWMNDPNGFSYYHGKYHMFYQYYPYATCWGPMHWGHAVSEDLLHWEYLPATLAPDSPCDRDGCFSGSAVELEDGRQLLMYTGVMEMRLPDGGRRQIQTQCLAVGDGVDYEKYAENPVLDENNLPPGGSPYDFRDPKVWKKKDGTYLCVAGNRPADGSGQILLYSSEDCFHWKFKKVLAENKNRYGKMWECPDFFPLDGKQILLVSPQDMLPQGFEYHNGNGTVCFIGSYDETTDDFTEESNQAVDYGIDFYAPQTVLTPDGRRVMIGWMQNWDTCNMHRQMNADEKWFGQMSLPRELFLKNGRLYQRPIRELEELRRNEISFRDVCFSGNLQLEGIRGRCVDMEVEVESEDANEAYHRFSVRFAQNENYQTSVSYRPHEAVLKIDRKFSGSRRAIIHQRRSRVESEKGKLRLRLILDRFSAEIFVNDGEQVLTATMYTEQAADGISFFADGRVRMNVVKYDLV